MYESVNVRKLEESLADFTFVIETNAKQKKADNFRFFFERGFVYIWMDQFEKAKEDLEKALLITDDATVVGWLSYTLFRLNNFEKAFELSDKALEKDKDLRVSMYIKATLLQVCLLLFPDSEGQREIFRGD